MTDSDSEKLNILICTPLNADPKRGYAFCMARAMLFFALAKSDVPKQIDVQFCWSSSLPGNRHILVADASKRECSHVLFWDADITAPPDCIVRLVNHHLPIVAVNYPKKTIEAPPTAYIDTDEYVGPCWTQKQHAGLQAVSHCGFGLMLIEMRVFETMKPPFFAFTQAGPDGLATLLEDYFFCNKAREAGFDVVIDHDLSKQIGHIGDFEYTCDMADIAQMAKQELYRAMPTDAPDVPL